MKLVDQNRHGLFAESDGVAPLIYSVRATAAVLAALEESGAKIEPLPGHADAFSVELGDRMPAGIVASSLPRTRLTDLRMRGEPPAHGIYEDCWSQVEWTPCPVCGAPVVWYEAGYVPGHRVCTRPPYHHSLARD